MLKVWVCGVIMETKWMGKVGSELVFSVEWMVKMVKGVWVYSRPGLRCRVVRVRAAMAGHVWTISWIGGGHLPLMYCSSAFLQEKECGVCLGLPLVQRHNLLPL